MPVVVAGEARRGLRGALEHEARGEEQRLGVLVEVAAHLPGAHAQGRQLDSSFAIKKPGLSVQADRVLSARFSGICYAPASCGSNRRERRNYISSGQIQVELRRFVVAGVALRVALDLDRAQVVAGDVAGDVDRRRSTRSRSW